MAIEAVDASIITMIAAGVSGTMLAGLKVMGRIRGNGCRGHCHSEGLGERVASVETEVRLLREEMRNNFKALWARLDKLSP